ncbi:MAG: ATP-binding protein [Thermoplasmata archaeon]|nr:ATP-binding protein [Thermoplasmata archaeon]
MPGGSYERYGLTSNPFRDLASESIEEVGLYHVNQEVDETLRTIKDEVFDKENKAIVAVVGPHGAGKTERLLVTMAEAKERGAFAVYYDVPAKTARILRGVATQFQTVAASKGRAKLFSQPPWLRAMVGLTKVNDEKYDAKEAGKIIGQALNSTAPSFLLLNDLNNLVESHEVNAFAKVIQEVTDTVKPGVLVMFSCYASYLTWLNANHPALASRINRTLTLSGFSDEEAALLLAKKLLVKRLVEDLDPIYPFDREAIHLLNEAANQNPRRLLELADLAVEYGAAHRSYRVDTEVVNAVLLQRAANAPPPASSLQLAPPKAPGTAAAPPTPHAPAETTSKTAGKSEPKANWAES